MDTAHFLAWFVRVDFNRTKIEIILSGILRKHTHINKPLHLNNHHPPPQSKNTVNLITYTFHIFQGTYTQHMCAHIHPMFWIFYRCYNQILWTVMGCLGAGNCHIHDFIWASQQLYEREAITIPRRQNWDPEGRVPQPKKGSRCQSRN